MSVRMGKKFVEMGVQIIGGSLLCKWRDCIETSAAPGSYPVALALNFAAQGLPAIAAFVAHQHGVAATILGAALRLMKISHVETQKISMSLMDARKPLTRRPLQPACRTWPGMRRLPKY